MIGVPFHVSDITVRDKRLYSFFPKFHSLTPLHLALVRVRLTAKLGDRFYKQLLGPLDRSPEVTLNNRGWAGERARERYRRVGWSLRYSVQESHRQLVVKSKVVSNLGGTTYYSTKYLY
jgi:hypothetical protein